jgi:hypothetical protein
MQFSIKVKIFCVVIQFNTMKPTLYFLIMIEIVYSFSGDNSTEVELGFDVNLIPNDLQNEIIQTNFCGETPGICNESMSDINIIINGTVEEIYISVYNLTIILLVCIFVQFLTAAIIIKAIYFTKKRIQYHVGERNRIVRDDIFDPLTSGV